MKQITFITLEIKNNLLYGKLVHNLKHDARERLSKTLVIKNNSHDGLFNHIVIYKVFPTAKMSCK